MSLPEPPLNASRMPLVDRRQNQRRSARPVAPWPINDPPRATKATNRSCQFFGTEA